MAQLKRFNPNDKLKPFDCGDADLNGFLLEDSPSGANAMHHTSELLAVTYIIEDDTQTIAYFSLLNDKIDRYIADETAWKKLSKDIPFSMRRKSQPAVKLGRLAVSLSYQHQGWGSNILNALKQWFINDNKTGCRYITVDALVDKVDFYKKYGFNILVTPQVDDETVLMYYDLKKFVSTKR